jgi:glycosyltransferase involved in cell wall biosynthesis
MKTKFKFVVPSYNNEEWVEYNIASILNQTYENYEVLYIDDASTDNTYNKVIEIVSKDSRFKVIRREENKGAAYNYFFELEEYLNNDEDIIIHLDGDDWLYDENVLQNLLDYYEKTGVWMTYGKFICYKGSTENLEIGYPQSTEYPEFVRKHKLYKRDTWRASHLRTYKTKLFNALNKDDLYSKVDGKLFWHGLDLAFQYPYMEMCSPDKIGVVDFITCVYNQAPKNQIRTAEREHTNNSIYENEIRNKKTYASGLSGERLPQINVYGDYLETHNIPTKFSYCYNRTFGDYDILFLQDGSILDYLNGRIQNPEGVKVIARVCENRKFFNQAAVVEAVKSNPSAFDLILTWDAELTKLPNAVFCPLTDLTQFNTLPNELKASDLLIHKKSKLVSAVSSTKSMVDGHYKRLEFIKQIAHKVDLYGRGIREVASKAEALNDYMFSIAIENDKSENYFTEKLTDCILTGTVPIYYGATNIQDFFDVEGMIIFDTIEELNAIIDSLTPELYEQKYKALVKNYIATLAQYPTTHDSMYDLYYNRLINK